MMISGNTGRCDIKFQCVLVTGASGFLGRPLVERLLEAGYKVTALGMRREKSPFAPSVDYQCVNLADPTSSLEFLLPWRWDAVVNLAGPLPDKRASTPDDSRTLYQHAHIALNVCLGIKPSWSGRLIHVSSMDVYGSPENLPVKETHPRKPTSTYGIAKCLAEDIVLAMAQYKNLDYWVLRIPGLFSETRHAGALYHFMKAAASGRPIVISALEPTPWDILHRDDAVEAIMLALASEVRNPGPINISYGHPVELVAMAERIATWGGSRVAVENTYGIRHPVFQMSIEKVSRLFAWPPASLQSRITHLWEVFSSHFQSDGLMV